MFEFSGPSFLEHRTSILVAPPNSAGGSTVQPEGTCQSESNIMTHVKELALRKALRCISNRQNEIRLTGGTSCSDSANCNSRAQHAGEPAVAIAPLDVIPSRNSAQSPWASTMFLSHESSHGMRNPSVHFKLS